ncbi:hypothetical protein E2562_023503 [Oryza meyeriana var. granulata]|uniref:Phage protein n=1 Tax=Oryza meyeriana var. granulata TaxID=110450 RepID=A0A6G1BZT5_9ORYZ|nr:hypothetical protein E2562_023503 [Oryza meyeriana var. granulata]
MEIDKMRQNSVLYEQMMKRNANKRSIAGRLEKAAATMNNKRIGRGEAMAAGILAGLAVAYTLTTLMNKQQETKEA